MPVPAPSWEKKWKWPHKYFEFKSLCNKNRLIFSCVNVYVIPSPCTLPPLSPSTSIIHCPFLYVLLILNSAPLQPGTDVFEFTLAFMCTSFHTVLCRVGDQKAIAHVRTGSSQLSTKEQSVVNVWLWLDGGTSRQCLFFFFFSLFFHDLVIPWGFALCHAIPRKIRMWNRTFCGRWQDQRRQRWKKAVECILRSQPLFLLSPGVHYSAYLCCQSCPSGSSFPKTAPSTVPREQRLPVGLFFLASDRVWWGSALAVVSSDLACCRERRVGCHFDVRAAVAHPAVPACLGAASSSPCARGEVTCLRGASSPPVDPRASRAHVLGWVGSLSV